jgi:hypothetical protein
MSSRSNILSHTIAGPRVGWRMKLRAGVALIGIATAFGSVGAMAEESISFPARSADLAPDSYWTVAEFDEGCCTLDINLRRWNGSQWVGGSGGAQTQDYDWNVPLYAPANGVVASCWRNFPDDPASGAALENEDKIFTGGNHVVIVTDGGNAISINHLKQGTIPAELCPSNAGSSQYPSTMDKDPKKQWRVAAYIKPADRPRVHEGQFIGRIGESGSTGGPHLHISMHKVVAPGNANTYTELAKDSSPMDIRYGWAHPFDKKKQATSAGWFRLRGTDFSGEPNYPDCKPNCGEKMLHASPYLRRADASAGDIKGGDVLFLSGNRAVTGTVASNNGHLKLVTWDLVGVDKIEREGEFEAGAVKEVALAEVASDYVLAAVRQSDDVLKMIAFHVGPTGNLLRIADMSAGKISQLDMATFGGADRKAATAVRDEFGNFKLIVWDLAFETDGSAKIVRLGEASAGTVSALSVSRASPFNGVLTAVRDSEQNLTLIPWKVSTDGKTITRGEHATAGAVGTELSVASLAKGAAVAMRDSDGNLRIVTWSASSNGSMGGRRETEIAGAISEVDLLTTPHGGSNLTSVVRGSEGELLLIGWAVDDDGKNLRRIGSSEAGAASKIAAASVSRSYVGLDPRDMILTAVRDSGGNLKLVTWDTNLVNP